MFTGIDIFINMINEEINKIKYLFGYKPGVVISEQTTPPTTTSGSTTPPPATTTSGSTTPPPATSGSTTNKIKQKDLNKLRDCSDYNSTGSKSKNKLTKGEELNGFVIFNGSDGKPACKKHRQKD